MSQICRHGQLKRACQLCQLEEEVASLQELCAEVYQIVGMLCFDEANIELVLDNLSAAAQGDTLPHETLLPWVKKGLSNVNKHLFQQPET